MVGRFVAQNHTHGPPADLWMLMTTKGDSSHTHMALGSEEVGKKNGVVDGESYLGTWLCGDDVNRWWKWGRGRGTPAQLSVCGLQRDGFFLHVFYILF